MTQLALPSLSSKTSRWWATLLAVAAGVAVVAAVVWAVAFRPGSGAAVDAAQFVRVAPIDLDVRLRKDGELQAINNIEIFSEVEGQTTIQQIVREGDSVREGTVLVVLDSSSIRQKIEDTTIELQKAEADVTNAREMRDIQESKNAADLEAAQVSLTLAQLDLKDYEEAAYPQQLANAQTDLEMSQIDLKNRREDLGQRRNLFAKGYVTAADVKKAELEVTKAENAVDKAQTALKRLTEYTHASDLAAKRNALSQAEQKLVRVKRENASQMSQKSADVAAREQNFSIIRRRLERLQQQADACTIKAPTSGMVVYATSNDRNAQNLIQEGATVRERQTLLRLPDTSSMKAVLRVPEAQVWRLRPGMRALVRISGMAEPVGANLDKISVLADSGQRWFNPDTKEYPVDLVLDRTPPNLKPGMTVQAEVLIDRVEKTLAVPLTTIYSVGNKSFVFKREGGRTVPAEITVGQINDTHASIRKGLTDGEEVLILERGQGQRLLEDAGIKIEPTTRPTGFDRGGGAPGGPGGDRPRRNRDGAGPGGPGAGPGGDSGGTPGADRPRRNRDGAAPGGQPGANATPPAPSPAPSTPAH